MPATHSPADIEHIIASASSAASTPCRGVIEILRATSADAVASRGFKELARQRSGFTFRV